MVRILLEKENDIKREEIRGIYIIGLLTILITMKVTVHLDPITDDFWSFVIACFAIYSFFTILAYSNLPKQLINPLKEFAETFMFLGLATLVVYFFVIICIATIASPFLLIALIVMACLIVFLTYKIKRLRK